MSCLSLQGEKWAGTQALLIWQGRCSMLCCDTILTVTEGWDGEYCTKSSARCFLGFETGWFGGVAISLLVEQITPSAHGHYL